MLTPEQLEEAREIFRQEEIARRREKKRKIEQAQRIKDAMTVEEKIAFMNTAYKDMPELLQTGMIQRPQMFNSIHILHPHLSGQHETFAARLIRFRDKYGLDKESFLNICNVYAKQFDKKARKASGRKKQKTRITAKDLDNYENFNVCPKMDKMIVIAKAMGMSIDYFAGYGEQDSKSNNEIIEAKFRKNKKKKYKVYKEDDVA